MSPGPAQRRSDCEQTSEEEQQHSRAFHHQVQISSACALCNHQHPAKRERERNQRKHDQTSRRIGEADHKRDDICSDGGYGVLRSSCSITDASGKSSLTRSEIGGKIAKVVHYEDVRDEQPYRYRQEKWENAPVSGLQVRSPGDRDHSKKNKDEYV